MSVNGALDCHERVVWDEDPQEHGMPVGVVGQPAPMQVSLEQLWSMPTQAILDALAQRSKAELGQNLEDINKFGEKLGKRLVPIGETDRTPQGCMRCHTMHARCDGKRPCGRCLSRNVEAECAYPSDSDFVAPPRKPRPRQKRPFEETLSGPGEGVPGELVNIGEAPKVVSVHSMVQQQMAMVPQQEGQPPPPPQMQQSCIASAALAASLLLPARHQILLPARQQILLPARQQLPARRQQKRTSKSNTRPIRREGVTASGDLLCPHGIEKRYCLDAGCLANGGGNAMCQHGRRRRCCKEQDCKNETERRRNDVEGRRCDHGRQKRLCREGECLKEFSAASKAYRDLAQQRRSEIIPLPMIKLVPMALKSLRKICEHQGLRFALLHFACFFVYFARCSRFTRLSLTGCQCKKNTPAEPQNCNLS